MFRKTTSIIKTLAVAAALTLFFSSLAFSAGKDDKNASLTTININEASAKEIMNLPGIGRKKAEAIVAYRQEHGRFASADDLAKVEGIGKKTVEHMRDYISTE